jgi:hypothetical protein
MSPHVHNTSETTTVGRRALTRGAVWSVPAVTLAVAAPAAAATSGCTVQLGKLDWDLFTNGTNQLNKVLTTTISGVTVTLTVTGDFAGNNGVVTSTSTGALSKVMRFYDQENKTGTSQTITVTFNKQVQNVSFSLLDVDSQSGRPNNAYEDLVTVLTPGWIGVRHSNVKGSGTAADPYRAKTTSSPADGSSNISNVDLTWASKLTTVSFKYAQDGKVDGGPFIGISDILFQTVC